jgi:hypothetical protein
MSVLSNSLSLPIKVFMFRTAKMDISPTGLDITTPKTDLAGESNNNLRRSLTPGAQNDNMDIEGSSDESVVDIPNKTPAEPAADDTAQIV